MLLRAWYAGPVISGAGDYCKAEPYVVLGPKGQERSLRVDASRNGQMVQRR
jgi:hypothetical protein